MSQGYDEATGAAVVLWQAYESREDCQEVIPLPAAPVIHTQARQLSFHRLAVAYSLHGALLLRFPLPCAHCVRPPALLPLVRSLGAGSHLVWQWCLCPA